MSTLWILPKWPFPAIDGATRAHMALLSNWPKSAGPLDLVIFSPAEKANSLSEDQIEGFRREVGFRNLLLLPLPSQSRQRRVLQSFFGRSSLPATAQGFNHRKSQDLFTAWCRDKKWDHLVIDGTHAGALFYRESKKWAFPQAGRRILRAHNVESDLWGQSASRALFPMRQILLNEQRLMRAFELDLISQCDAIATVSLNDAETFTLQQSEFYPERKSVACSTIPIGFDWPKVSSLPDQEAPDRQENNPASVDHSISRLLFVGRLDWPPNHEGLSWFIQQVWPYVRQYRPHLKLDVVGGFASPTLLKLCREQDGITAHGLVEDIAPFYKACDLSIIPILTGSGTRVKAIESARYGRTLISTSKGIEGVPLQDNRDFLLADRAEDWIQILKMLNKGHTRDLSREIFLNGRISFDRSLIQDQFIHQVLDPSQAPASSDIEKFKSSMNQEVSP